MDRSFLRHAAVYGLATLLVQAGSFVLLPIYLRCLSPADYGVLEVVGRLAETVGTILLFGGFRQALYTFYQQAQTEPARRQVVSGTFALVIASCLLGGVLLFLLEPRLGGWLALGGDHSGQESGLLRLAILGILLEPLSIIPLGLIQARVESGTYVVVVVSQFLFRVGLAIFLVRYLRWGVSGALLATAITGMVFGLSLTVRELSGGMAWPQWQQLRDMIGFSLPLLPGGLCFFVMHHGDRFFLLHYSDEAQVGTYALGYKLAMVVRLFSLVPLHMVWSSRMYDVARTAEAPVTFGRVFTRILAAYLFVGLGLCLFAPEVVLILGGSAYLDAVIVVAPVVLACFFQSAAALCDAGLYVSHKTDRKLWISLASTLITVSLYALLIPRLGAMGAAWATLAGFGFMAVTTYAVTQRIFFVQYEWTRLGGICLLAGGLWLLGCFLPAGPWGFLGKTLLLLAAPLLAWFTALSSDTDRQFVREGVRLLLDRLGWKHRPDKEPEPAMPVTLG